MTHQNITNQMRRICESCCISRTQWAELTQWVELMHTKIHSWCTARFTDWVSWIDMPRNTRSVCITACITNSMTHVNYYIHHELHEKKNCITEVCVCVCVCVWMTKGIYESQWLIIGLLQGSFFTENTNYKALLWKMTYKDKATPLRVPGRRIYVSSMTCCNITRQMRRICVRSI